tara:strand:- start:414 stop:584 length:171 start_codon:yes stop_codon:yes gene_type:complete
MKLTNYIVYIESSTGALRQMFESDKWGVAQKIFEELKGNFPMNKYVIHAEVDGQDN